VEKFQKKDGMIMKKTTLKKINLKNIRDIYYEPDKDRYSVIEYNSSSKKIDKTTFMALLQNLCGLRFDRRTK